MADTTRGMDPMRAKLKQARAEIEAVLKKHDIAGFVSLHAPGWGETFWNIWPSYSILIGDFPAIRFKSKLADYKGDSALQLQHQAHTAEMVHALGMSVGQCGFQFMELDQVVTAAVKAQHNDGAHIPEPSKLNPGVH